MKKVLGILSILCFLVGLFLVGRIYYIKNAYTEPFDIVEEVVKEAKEDNDKSIYIISEKDWELKSENSTFNDIREPLDWEDFKGFVQKCAASGYSLLFDEGKATYDVMRKYYKDNHRAVDVMCIEYNNENGQQIDTKDIKLLVEDIKDSWKVVGKTN